VRNEDPQGQGSDGHVHIENPPPPFDTRNDPARIVRQEATHQRPEHASDPEHGSDESLVLTSLSGWEEIGDHDERHRDDTSRTHPLHAAERDELVHPVTDQRQVTKLPSQSAQDRPEKKQTHRPQFDGSAAVHVREFSIDRNE